MNKVQLGIIMIILTQNCFSSDNRSCSRPSLDAHSPLLLTTTPQSSNSNSPKTQSTTNSPTRPVPIYDTDLGFQLRSPAYVRTEEYGLYHTEQCRHITIIFTATLCSLGLIGVIIQQTVLT